MQIVFVSLFPEMLLPAVDHSILARAQAAGLVEFSAINPRDFATDLHKTVDGKPFGGGPGMVLQCEQMSAALRSVPKTTSRRVVFFEPTGTHLTQAKVLDLSAARQLVLVCGHYEGIDHRIVEQWATDVVSLGDFILTGGELPALVLADAVVRTLPGALGDSASLSEDSHSDGLLSYPQYTRPQVFGDKSVPEVLTSGNHGEVARWRRQQQLQLTRRNRPDLFCQAPLSDDDLKLL